MKKVLMLSTGGTVASEPGPDGLVPALTGEKMTEMLPVLGEFCKITCRELMALDSSNIQPHHWKEIADEIAEEYGNYDGFVITHGTDTMAYTAAALSSMLINLAKPVVITGSQLPAGARGTDALENLENSFRTAVSCVPGVHLVFGDKIISGKRAMKMHTKNFDAFYSINAPYEAYICEGRTKWEALPDYERGSFEVKSGIEEKVALIKLIPGSAPEIIDFYLEKGYRGIVIQGFGAGGVPNDENSFLPALEKAIKQGVVVVCATQCLYDGVNLETYPIGVLAERLGALSAEEMTAERAVTKLMWALGNSESAEEAKKLFAGD